MSNVKMYVKDGCPYCAAARKHYKTEGIAFDEINIHRVDGAKEELLKLTDGQRIVPVIVEDGRVKIGFDGG